MNEGQCTISYYFGKKVVIQSPVILSRAVGKFRDVFYFDIFQK